MQVCQHQMSFLLYFCIDNFVVIYDLFPAVIFCVMTGRIYIALCNGFHYLTFFPAVGSLLCYNFDVYAVQVFHYLLLLDLA